MRRLTWGRSLFRSGLSLGLAMAVAACAHRGPEARVADYRRALDARDGQALLEMMAPHLAHDLDIEALAHFLEENPSTVARARAQTDAVTRIQATVSFASGARMTLERVDQRWRVVSGPLVLPLLSTPEAALDTFLFASRGHLGLLRRVLPADARARFASDAALAQHLTRIRPRIEALASALPARPKFEVEGDRARLKWGPGQVLRLIREEDGWRVLDLE